MNKKGFAPIVLVLIVVGVLIVTTGALYYRIPKNTTVRHEEITNNSKQTIQASTTVSQRPSIIEISGPKTVSVDVSEVQQWNLRVADPDSKKLHFKIWWGDGLLSEEYDGLLPKDQKEKIFIFNHHYSKALTYAIDFKVSDESGLRDEKVYRIDAIKGPTAYEQPVITDCKNYVNDEYSFSLFCPPIYQLFVSRGKDIPSTAILYLKENNKDRNSIISLMAGAYAPDYLQTPLEKMRMVVQDNTIESVGVITPYYDAFYVALVYSDIDRKKYHIIFPEVPIINVKEAESRLSNLTKADCNEIEYYPVRISDGFKMKSSKIINGMKLDTLAGTIYGFPAWGEGGGNLVIPINKTKSLRLTTYLGGYGDLPENLTIINYREFYKKSLKILGPQPKELVCYSM